MQAVLIHQHNFHRRDAKHAEGFFAVSVVHVGEHTLWALPLSAPTCGRSSGFSRLNQAGRKSIG